MNKSIAILILLIAVIVLGILLFIRTKEHGDLTRREENAKAKIKELDHELDSLYNVVEVTTKSLSKSDSDILSYKSEIAKLNSRKTQIKTRHEKDTFIIHPSDSVRLRKLAEYFPSVLSR